MSSLTLGALYFSIVLGASPASSRRGPMESAAAIQRANDCLRAYAIAVEVGHRHVAPSQNAVAEIEDGVERFNAQARLPGLPDELNPLTVDAEKVKAFLLRLPALPPARLSALRGHVLYLNRPELLLRVSSPVRVSAIAAARDLDVEDASSAIVVARLGAHVDEALARDRATRARQRMEAEDAEIARQDAGEPTDAMSGAALVELSTAQRRRYAAAVVWKSCIAELVEIHPRDEALARELGEATQAAARFLVAPWTGMPGR